MKKLRDKMLHFEADPPSGVWDRIDSRLDEGTGFSRRLYYYEQLPPGHIWLSISKKLDGAKRIISIPAYRKITRYAAAAILLVISGIAILQVVTGEKSPSGGNIQAVLPVAGVEGDIIPDMKSGAEDTGQVIQIAAPVREKATPEHPSTKAYTASRKPARRVQTASLSEPAPGNYIIYHKDDSTTLRLSKKVAPLVKCAGENIVCLLHLRKLQEKAAATTVAGDFTGILEMLANLRENR